MTRVRDMVRTNPSDAIVDQDILTECIDACFECAFRVIALWLCTIKRTADNGEAPRPKG